MAHPQDTITQADLVETYQQPWEHYWLERVDETLYPTEPEYRRIFENVQVLLHQPRQLLDLGCGVGIFSINQLRRFPDLQVTAVDLSQPQLHTAERLSQQYGVSDRVRFVNASVEDIPLHRRADFAPDHIVMTEVLEHLLEPEKALGEIHRLCAPQTRVIISVPQIYHGGAEGIFYRQVDRDGTVIADTQNPATLRDDLPVFKYYHAQFASPQIRALLTANGFVIDTITPVSFMIPARKPAPNEGLFGKTLRRGYNGMARPINRLVETRASRTLDRALARLNAGTWAKNLIISCQIQD